MKKTLLFIGLAMCASFAFAQTNNYNAGKVQRGLDNMTVSTKISDKQVDYKASIFTKAPGDTIYQWNFTSATNTADMPAVYGSDGKVVGTMLVNGEALDPHTVNYNCSYWQYVPDTNWFNESFFTNNYSTLSQGWRPVTSYMIEDLGEGQFMLASMIDYDANDGFPNSFMEFAAVPNIEGTSVVNIYIKQEYRKYYDQCWVDYQVNGAWKTREINVTGVDLDVNDWGAVETMYTMPIELANEANLKIRVRYSGTERNVRVHGYFWAIGQIALIAGGPNDWTGYNQSYVEGAYGTLPQPLNLPLTWMSSLSNRGSNDRNNITVVANHIHGTDTTALPLRNSNMGNLAAGNSSILKYVYINEGGWFNVSQEDWADHAAWYGVGSVYGTNTNTNGTCFPTTELGLNKVQVSVTSEGANPLTWASMPYRVVGNSYYGANDSRNGYRWGHDNGIIPSAINLYGTYAVGVTDDGYITDEGHYNEDGYLVAVRYTTPGVIPTDDNGDPWVLLGVELVTSAEVLTGDLSGSSIIPVCFEDSYPDEEHISFNTVITGVNNQPTTYNSGSEISNFMTNGYKVAEGANYKAATFFFPEQPELTPNTSYRVGYQLAGDNKFAVAATRSSYIMQDEEGNDMWMPIDSTEAIAGYGRNFVPTSYDIIVADPADPDSRIIWAGAYNTQFPMVRAIVGPRKAINRHAILPDCNNNQVVLTYFGDTVCGVEDLTAAEGTNPTIYIYANGDHSVLDKLYIDGVEVQPYNESDGTGDENFYIVGDDNIEIGEVVVLYRKYWAYTFENISGQHTIKATSRQAEWETDGIDPLASDVVMQLAPNPATSQVAMVLSGVTGMVNCSIIDMSGRVVYNNTVNAEARNTIDLSNVPAGAYFVRINNDSFVKVEKLIVR